MYASEDLISFVPDRPGHDRKYAVNTDRAFDFLNWEAKKSFLDGIHDVIYDVASRLDMLKKLKKIRNKRLAG
jgi:dTDP-glucose 4,6-dehydratase